MLLGLPVLVALRIEDVKLVKGRPIEAGEHRCERRRRGLPAQLHTREVAVGNPYFSADLCERKTASMARLTKWSVRVGLHNFLLSQGSCQQILRVRQILFNAFLEP